MSMNFRDWIRIPISDAVLIVASGGVLGWYSPRFDLGAIAGVVLLARFRGRVQSVVGAFSFSLLALVSGTVGPRFAHAPAEFAHLAAATCAIWLCAFLSSSTKPVATAPLKGESPSYTANVWKTFLKLFPGWMWIARPDGTLEFVSQGALEYSGFTNEKVLTEGLGFDSVHPDDRQRRTEHWKKLLKAEEPGEIEMRIRGADGNYRWFASRSYPIRDAGGRLERWVSINWDIDERKTAEQQIRDQLTQLNLLGEIGRASCRERV